MVITPLLILCKLLTFLNKTLIYNLRIITPLFQVEKYNFKNIWNQIINSADWEYLEKWSADNVFFLKIMVLRFILQMKCSHKQRSDYPPLKCLNPGYLLGIAWFFRWIARKR